MSEELYGTPTYQKCHVCGEEDYCPIFIIGKGSVCKECLYSETYKLQVIVDKSNGGGK